jgi:geranylgeranyl pyrophosphate synthase
MEPRLDPALLERLGHRLSAVAQTGGDWLGEPLLGVLDRPGKRLRPALLYAVAALGPQVDEVAALDCATALELLHLSSLVHDDLMDSAGSRGGRPTIHRTHGMAAAVLGGDILAAAGGALIARVAQTASTAWQDAYLAMCRGQAQETALRHTFPSVDECVSIMEGKTATLIGAACRLGAWCGGMPPAQQDAFGAYGLAFGLVFQLLDDLMDVLSTARLWGKPVQHDVGQGVFTLPVILAGSTAYAEVRALGIKPALDMLTQWAGDASAALNGIPGSEQLRELPLRYAETILSGRTDPAHRTLVEPLLLT